MAQYAVVLFRRYTATAPFERQKFKRSETPTETTQ